MTSARVALAAALLVIGFLAGRFLAPHTDRAGANTRAPHAPTSADATPARASHASARAPTHAAPPYALPNTHVHAVPNTATGRRYEVWVDLPPSYFESDRRFPVVFVTDSDYGFPLVRSLRRRVGAKGRNIEDFVLVGLSYGVGEQSMPSKRRDYTPTDPFARPGGADDRDEYDRASTYGQAAAYRDYLERDVFPLIAREYRVDPRRRIYLGHSLGGLFGSYVLLTKPTMFSHYILGSPSLWFDRRTIFDLEAEYARRHRDLPARVYLPIGGYETVGDTPRHLNATDMVGDVRSFEQRLRGRGYPGLHVESEVLPGEDHLTVFPGMATRGLLWALPGTGPYRGY